MRMLLSPTSLQSRAPRLKHAFGAGDAPVALAGIAACLLIWVLRRPEQLTHPYVWDEEGQIVGRFVDHGWLDVLRPVAGYLTLPPSFLVPLSAQISFVHLPELMYAFAFLVFAVTVVALVLPDSRWGGLQTRIAMAIAAALVPANPETFGVLLYSFWWATLWPLIVLGWRRSLWLVRAPMLAVASLSSPAAGALFAVYAVAYARGRRLRDAISAGILLAGFVAELVFVRTSPRAGPLHQDALAVAEQVLRNGGFFVANWLSVDHPDRAFLALVGALLLGFLLCVGVTTARIGRGDEILLLGLGALVFSVVSALPEALLTNPVSAGPRYFFLPYIGLAWTLVVISRSHLARQVRLAAVLVLALSLLNLATTFSRSPSTTTARLSWPAELRKCALSGLPVVPVPIYFDGSTNYWSLDLAPAQCWDLSTSPLFQTR